MFSNVILVIRFTINSWNSDFASLYTDKNLFLSSVLPHFFDKEKSKLVWSGLVLFEKKVLPMALNTWMQSSTIFMYTRQIWQGDKRTTKQLGEPCKCLQCALWIIPDASKPQKRPKWNQLYVQSLSRSGYLSRISPLFRPWCCPKSTFLERCPKKKWLTEKNIITKIKCVCVCGGGGAKAVWNFSKNSSDLVAGSFPSLDNV